MASTSTQVVSPTDDTKVPLVKLSNANYPAWRRSIVSYFHLKNLTNFIGTDQAATQDQNNEYRAMLILLGTLDEKHQVKVQGCSTAYEVFKRIETLYVDYGKANAARLLRNFFSYKKVKADKMCDYISKMENMKNELLRAGQSLNDEIFMSQLISNLPKGYETMIAIWDAKLPEERKVSDLVSAILIREEELRRTDDEDQQVYAAFKRRMTIEERKKITNCAKCGEKGHWARECSAKPKEVSKVAKKIGNHMF